MPLQEYEEDYYIYQTREFLTAYDPNEMVGWISKRFLEVVPKFTDPRGKSLLDVGCGVGLLAHLAQRAGFDAYGIDFSPRSIRLGSVHLNMQGRLYCGDVSDLRSFVGTRKFDVVTIFEVLEHIENPGQVMRLVSDCLSDAGLVVLSIPNADRFHPQADETDSPPHHLTFWTKRAIQRFVEEGGFKIVYHEVQPKSCGLGLTKLYEKKVIGNSRLGAERRVRIHRSWAPIRTVLWGFIRKRNDLMEYVSRKLGVEGRCQLIIAAKTAGTANERAETRGRVLGSVRRK
jgi:2-polyprenyl-3-methyl-5-hydroxy-6-metoxy-1,4-benzoquinol methylase